MNKNKPAGWLGAMVNVASATSTTSAAAVAVVAKAKIF